MRPTTDHARVEPIRVLWLAKGLGPGGMERLLETHARIGDREQFEYQAAYLVERPHSVVPSLRSAGVDCTRLGHGRDLDPRWLMQLRQLVRRERIDVVHTHSPMIASLARPALRAMRRRPALVYTEHNSWDCYGGPTRLANAATYPFDDAQVAVSIAAASPPGPLARRVEVLVHGIDLDAVAAVRPARNEVRAELGLEPHETVVVVVANLRREKGHDLLLQAAVELSADHPDVVILCVGQGPLEQELRALHQSSGLGDRFRFLGFRDDVHRVLAASDVFALSSRHEGLPVALMEASAMGLPIVVTRVGGLPDVIEDGVSGLLVEPEDPSRLAAALRSVIDDPALGRTLAEGSRAMARRFDARAAVDRLESIYREVRR